MLRAGARRLSISVFTILLGCFGTTSGRCQTAPVPEVVSRGKKATVFIRDRDSSGSGFCIDGSGIFVTNEHVVEEAPGGQVAVIVNPSEKTQTILRGRVIRTDKARDLALVKTEGATGLTTLSLGTTDGLFETMPLTAFGFPFGQDLALTRNEYPAVTITTGRITALRRIKEELEQIQLDAALNPGNSGGPVLNEKGEVVGIVVAGIEFAVGVNFAIPVSHLRQMLSRPEILFAPPAIAAGKQTAEQEFAIKVLTFSGQPADVTVEFTLSSGKSDRRTFAATRDGDLYRVRAAPVPALNRPKELKLSAQGDAGLVTGRVQDQDIRVGGEVMRLSNVRRIDQGAKPQVVLANGQTVPGSVVGLERVGIAFGEATLTMSFARFATILVEDLEPPTDSVAYRIVVRQGGKTIAEQNGSFKIEQPSPLPGGSGTALPGPAAIPGAGTVGTVLPRPGSPTLPVLTPPKLEQDKISVNLPDQVEDVVAGGGGRFLFLWLKKLQKVAVFDVSAAKIVKYLPAPGDDVKIAAGAEKLIMVLNDQNLMQRWDLRTLERELSVAAPEGGAVHSMALGYASYGPLLIVNGPTNFYDPATFKKLDLDMGFTRFYAWGSDPHDQMQLRASGDGSTFAAWRSATSYGVIMVVRVTGRKPEIVATTGLDHYLAVNFDGTLLYGPPFDSSLKAVAPGRFREQYLVPVYGGGYFVALVDKGARDRHQHKLTPSIYSELDKSLLVTLPEMDEMNWIGFPRSGFAIDKRIHIIPQAQVMITVADSRDRLVVRRFDLVNELDKAGIDYLFVYSLPLRVAQRGVKYSYQLDVKSKRGGVEVKLESGPPGMTLSKTGNLEWVIPLDYAGRDESIIIAVKDASGQEIYHSFKIGVV